MPFGLLLAAITVVLDQFTKALVLAFLEPYQAVEWAPFLSCVLVFNTGISFGLFAGETALLRWVLIGLALAVSVLLTSWLYKEKRLRVASALGLILGGAIGNVVDRIFRHAVVDFLDFHIGGWHWPAFNLADSAITVGVVLYMFTSLRDQLRSGKLTQK
jgi:signal peptidase II